jgi:Fe-S cluster assembly protein SufD
MSDTMTTSHKDRYLDDWKRVEAQHAPAWLKALRTEARAVFHDLEMPHTRMEDWRFTNVAPILNAAFASRTAAPAHELTRNDIQAQVYGEPAWSELVFIDGYWAPKLSRIPKTHANLTLAGIQAAAERDGDLVQEHLDRHVEKRDAFTALNSAFLQDGALISIPDHAAVQGAIHLVFITTDRARGMAAYPRNLILLGRGSEADIVESHVSLDGAGGYFNNAVVEIVLNENARLGYHRIVSEADDAHHLAVIKVRQEAHSRFTSFVFAFHGAILRNEIQVLLAGQQAECALHGLYLNDGDRLIDNFINIDHAVPHGRSRIAYKGVLDGTSKAVFTGKVNVRRGAQKTDSNQLSQNFLLADGATIDTRPQLEIYADDVKCTHGATVGSPPEPVVFYFRSRGMDEAMARGILTYGFASEVVYDLALDALRARLNAQIFERYSPKGRPQGA